MKDLIMIFALENAIEHGGMANIGPIMGKMMAAHPDLKKDPRSLSMSIREAVQKVNGMEFEEQKELLKKLGGPIELEKRERKDPMVPLEGAEDKKVRMRFAPGPSGPLHIGHTRAAILNDEYCKRYNGSFILRFEDTNPEKIDPDAYDMIPEDLDWLGVKVDEVYTQSDRFERYYEITEKLIERGFAYVCTMDPEKWRELKTRSKPCRERSLSPEEQMEGWEKMKEGYYSEGEASLVIKTDLSHRNPAVRDFVGMRIKHAPHPLTGDRYHLYPLYNLSVAIDDHLMGCTHILRGNDHLNNTTRQEYVFDHMEWKLPKFFHYGLVSIPETILKTSLIRDEISNGNFNGWEDVRLGTVRALSARGFEPASLRRYWTEVGIKPVDINFSWETLATMNREIIDRKCERFFFVEDPVSLNVSHDSSLSSKAPLHPEFPERGHREYTIESIDGVVKVVVPSHEMRDLARGDLIRLKDLANIRITDPETLKGKYSGNDVDALKKEEGKIIEWAPLGSIDCRILDPDGNIRFGKVEPLAISSAKEKRIVQFERVGFCKLRGSDPITGNFAHK